jgi:hypothetical protein
MAQRSTIASNVSKGTLGATTTNSKLFRVLQSHRITVFNAKIRIVQGSFATNSI